MFKLFVLLLVLVLVWAASLFVGLSLVIPVSVTALVALAVAGVFVAKRIRAKRASAELERALAAQAADHARSARPDLRAELSQVQSEFEKALAALKGSKLGRRGDALYAMPWYMIIGPPGAGKSTALRNSGLQFPYLSSRTGGGVRGVGGTRNCDWWLTNEAVILDTAGRWSTEDEDREEWLGFLGLVRRFRSKKPLNGVIVAVSVAEIGGASSDEIADLGRRIRERIDETQAELRLALPVYLLFTKCDLVPGFAEAFHGLSKADRGQIWGFTTSVDEPMRDPGGQFAAQMDGLLGQLERWVLGRLGDERQVRAREMMHGLPEQLRALAPKLRELTDVLFEENVLRDTPALRGAYFTSGTQEGHPIDRVMHRMAEAFGIRGQGPLSAQTVEQKSYFLHDVFTEVVFRDAGLAVRSEAERRRQALLRYGAAFAIFATALLVSVFPTYAYLENQRLLDAVEAELEATRAAVVAAADESQPLPEEALAPLRDRVALLDTWAEEGAPWLYRSGMYVGELIRGPLTLEHARVVRDAVVAPIFERDEVELGRFGADYAAMAGTVPPADAHRKNFDRLRRHLLLSRPAEPSQPALEGGLAARLTRALSRRWGSALSAKPSHLEAIGDHVSRYVALLPQHEALAFERDEAVVRRARAALDRADESALLLDSLEQRMSARGYDLVLADLLGRSVPSIHARTSIEGAYTRRAYEDHVKAALAGLIDGSVGEAWVLGPNRVGARSADEVEQRRRLVRSEYFRRYVEQWQQFARGLYATPPAGNEAALALFQDLTRGEPSVLSRLFLYIQHNVTLVEPPLAAAPAAADAAEAGARGAAERQLGARGAAAAEALLGAAVERAARPAFPGEVTEADVEAALRGFVRFGVPAAAREGEEPPPPPLAAYEEQLLYLRDAIQTHLDNPADPAPLTERITGSRTAVQGLIAEQEVGVRPALEALLWPPIDGISMSMGLASAMGAGRSWCSDVRGVFDEQLAGRYPFDPGGQDASLGDFAGFYLPREGAVFAFYEASLARSVERVGDSFQFSTRLGRSAGEVYQASLLPFLGAAREAGAAFFPTGSEAPVVELDLRLRPAEGVAVQRLSVGGHTITYQNEPERWQRVSWPGAEPAQGASLEVSGAGGMREQLTQDGEWGLFRLLESGTVTPIPGSRAFTVIFDLRSQGVRITLDVRPVRTDAPFFAAGGRDPAFLGVLRSAKARPPAEIVTSSRLCGAAR